MSVNQISQDYQHWWTPGHQQHLDDSPNSVPSHKSLVFAHHFQNFNLNQPNDDDEDGRQAVNINIDNNQQQQEQIHQQQLEVMFEKPLTPSDVGKLNRLVIPKQHAERHFPLNTSNGADSGGMLLSFEDEAGKFWRFRYSYWNSSQSYVLTKGWSRYVKEKRLDAGDVVIFQRHPTDLDRLFITWRRRQDPSQMDACSPAVVGGRSGSNSLYPAHHQHQNHAAYPSHQYQPEASAAGVVNGGRTLSFNGSTSSRTLRLFGVNMEYQFESDQSEPVTPDGSSTSSPITQQQQHGAAAYQHYSHFYPQAYYAMVQQDGSHSQHRG